MPAPVLVDITSAEHYNMITNELRSLMVKSLKKERWEGIDLGSPENYTNTAMVDRWAEEKNKWLDVSTL